MDDHQATHQQTSITQSDPQTIPLPPPHVAPAKSTSLQKVERVTGIVLILCAILFAIIGIVGVWGGFAGANDLVWRSLGSLAIVAFAAVVINIGARLSDRK